MRAALSFFAVTHALALAAMALLLRPGMDAAAFTLAERASYVASHSTAWRLGWLPWQLSALSDLWLSVAIWRSAAPNARRLAGAALALFVVAAVPEQWAELMLAWDLPSRAATGLEAWQRHWALYAAMTGVWANWAYTAMTYCWMRCAALKLARPVWPARWENALVGAFVLSGGLTGAATLLASPTMVGAWFTAASIVNGIAFPALVVWSLVLYRRLGALA